MNLEDLFMYQCRDVGNIHVCPKCNRMWTCNAKRKDCEQTYENLCPKCN